MNGASVILVAFLTSLLTATGTLFVLQRTDILESHADEQVTVPNLLGLPEADAMTNLRATGLVMMIQAREPNADAKPGTVIRQALPAGQAVGKGQAVAVTLAEQLPEVPDVRGQALAEATVLLVQSGYRVQTGNAVADAQVAEGRIAKQVPSPGSPLNKNEAVLLHPSSGPAQVEIPKVVGLTLSSAKTQIEKAGLKVGQLRWVYRDEAGYMAVLSQDPAAGGELPMMRNPAMRYIRSVLVVGS